MKRFFSIVSIFLLISIAGCGTSNEDVFLATGGNTLTPAVSGNLVFNFVQAQTTVPTGTTELHFDFFETGNSIVLSETRPFAAEVVFEDVSASIVRVEVTALNANGLPLASGMGPVTVVPSADTAVSLQLSSVTLDTLTVSPNPVTLDPGGTSQLSILGTFSNQTVASLQSELATYTDNNMAVATINSSGLVTAATAGTTSVTVSYTVEGSLSTATTSVPINVAGPTVTLSSASTFDTNTGLLNGATTTGWDGTVLRVSSFTLDQGVTLTVSGTQPFLLESSGDIFINGTVDAGGGDGGNGGDNGVNSPGGAGGLAGPGGFVGGAGGGVAINAINGEAGAGPGGGGGGQGVNVSAFDTSAGGGGAGHQVAGSQGSTSGNGTVGGSGGPAYSSLPDMLLGGSGGGGGSLEPDGVPINAMDDGGAGGGGGGGAVGMTALGTLLVGVNGTIDCSGGDGGNGGNAGGGGAGSGGGIRLLASVAPTVDGILNVAAGMAGPGPDAGAPGGTGSDGRTFVGLLP